MSDLTDFDCKTVRIFAYSSTHEQSNKGSGTRLKTESNTAGRDAKNLSPHMPYEARVIRAPRLLHKALPISLLILRKNRPFCSL